MTYRNNLHNKFTHLDFVSARSSSSWTIPPAPTWMSPPIRRPDIRPPQTINWPKIKIHFHFKIPAETKSFSLLNTLNMAVVVFCCLGLLLLCCVLSVAVRPVVQKRVMTGQQGRPLFISFVRPSSSSSSYCWAATRRRRRTETKQVRERVGWTAL